FKGSEVQRFRGSKVQRFKGSKVSGEASFASLPFDPFDPLPLRFSPLSLEATAATLESAGRCCPAFLLLCAKIA
ncbi:MAG: hypothetical protein ACE15E_06030, partial [Acidobacteriota bacterium]